MYSPKFTITPEILSGVAKISEIKAVVERSRVLPLNEAKLKREAIVRMAHTSTSIEGNKLAEYQVERVLSGHTVTADEKSILEVKNYQDALLEIEHWAKDNKKISLEGILALHKLLMKDLLDPDKVGKFRTGEIYVVDDLGDGREHLRYVGPKPEKVAYLLNELLKWYYLEDTIHPVIKAALIHIQFVTIHPFSDGNGRMTRLLATYVLYCSGWDFRKVIVLEDYYNRDRLSYYNALNTVQGEKYHEGADATSWLEYFIKGFLYEAEKVEDQLGSLAFGEGEEQIFLDRDEMKLMDYLTINGKLTSSDAQDVLGIPKRTAQFKIKRLVDNGLIRPQEKGPRMYYILAR